MYVIFKTMKLNEITEEENVHKEEKRTKNKVWGHVKFKILKKEVKTAKTVRGKLGECWVTGKWRRK